jgi:23S rRNA pseudouridine2604 synthase
MEEVRIAKLMAERGMCSRREAERLIAAGQVLVDGVVTSVQGSKARQDADITIAAAGRDALETKLTVVLHKPLGIVSTQPAPGQTPAWKLLTKRRASGSIDPAALERVTARPQAFSVAGRLDRASRGLLVLTEDGTVAKRIIGGHAVKKTYVVETAEEIRPSQVQKLGGSLALDGVPLRPMQVATAGPRRLRFVLVEGRKHQIRRVCRRIGLTVVDLFRESVGPFAIGDLDEGCWRIASPSELRALAARSEDRSHRSHGPQRTGAGRHG